MPSITDTIACPSDSEIAGYCSTCGLTLDTDTEEVEAAGLRSGGYFVVGDRYLVQSPNVAVERAVQDALR